MVSILQQHKESLEKQNSSLSNFHAHIHISNVATESLLYIIPDKVANEREVREVQEGATCFCDKKLSI